VPLAPFYLFSISLHLYLFSLSTCHLPAPPKARPGYHQTTIAPVLIVPRTVAAPLILFGMFF
jgi:hypothetical protein